MDVGPFFFTQPNPTHGHPTHVHLCSTVPHCRVVERYYGARILVRNLVYLPPKTQSMTLVVCRGSTDLAADMLRIVVNRRADVQSAVRRRQ